MKQWNKCSIGTHCCKYSLSPDALIRPSVVNAVIAVKVPVQFLCGRCFNLTQFRTTLPLVLLANM